MQSLDFLLLSGLFGAFLLSVCGFTCGDSTAGWCGLSLMLLLAAMNIINLLLDIRTELRRR